MKSTWKPVKRGPEPGGLSRYWHEELAIAVVSAVGANLSLLLLPFGYVLQWRWCMVNWWSRRAVLRDRREREDGDD